MLDLEQCGLEAVSCLPGIANQLVDDHDLAVQAAHQIAGSFMHAHLPTSYRCRRVEMMAIGLDDGVDAGRDNGIGSTIWPVAAQSVSW